MSFGVPLLFLQCGTMLLFSPLAGIIVRSSLWLGLPNTVDRISQGNSTDVWPEVFCVGSAVRTIDKSEMLTWTIWHIT